MNDVGFSVIYTRKRSDASYIDLFERMRMVGCRAIEIHAPNHDPLSRQVIDAIRTFHYRAIHTSDLASPSINTLDLAYYKQLADALDVTAITIHPHTMAQWRWVYDYFGDRTSFENMDRFKPFGQTADDMASIFNQRTPKRWTFDINHVFTVDPTLAMINDFTQQLAILGHYHISGFKDASLPHTTLNTTGQDAIIGAITTDHPIIIESLGFDDIVDFEQEFSYVIKRLASRTA